MSIRHLRKYFSQLYSRMVRESRKENRMENRSTAKDIRMKDAEKLMAYLSSLPEEQQW